MSGSGQGDHSTAPLVSVVTPFHNTAGFLDECMESVLGQTYENWEYILFDNCSTDGSREKAEDFARRDARIRFFTSSELLPQVPNYNRALRQISRESRYCKVVQADDWIFSDCIEKMVDLAERHPTVGIVSSYYLAGNVVKNVGLPYPSHRVSGRDVCRKMLLEASFFFGSQTSVMMRADLVRQRDPFYPLSNLHPDTEACYEVLRTCDFGFVHQVLSYMRLDDNSISGRVRTMRPGTLDSLIALKRYGPIYLEPSEFERRFRQREAEYLDVLGEALLRGEDAAFWDYHRSGLRQIDYEWSRRRIALHAAKAVARRLLSPWEVAKDLLGRRAPQAG